MGEAPTQKVNPWLIIVLIIVVLGAGIYFFWQYKKRSVADQVITPVTTSSDSNTNSQDLNGINEDINSLDSDLNQLDKVDASATNDVAPAL
jgi:hypothetical protein